ncbi:MAG: DUF4331 domain-containing protein [Acidobacteriota bacterium]|nr:DUF4331 domain-containing protein [Acidobacteriota bacterium]
MQKKSICFNLAQKILVLSLVFTILISPALGSSHREAPLTSFDRPADNTDVYAFRSTEAGRSGFVTIITNFIPFQDPSGGPHFYLFDPTVLYEIKIDNTGDGVEDISYQLQFNTRIVNPNTVLGMNTVNENGVISSLTDPDYNEVQTYTVTRVDRLSGRRGRVLGSGFIVPPDNIGPRVTPNYEANLGQPAVFNMGNGGRVFAGQRDEPFFIDVGGVFDAFNLRSLGTSGGVDSLRGLNIKTIAIEVPIADLTRSRAVPASPTASDAVVGIWSTASRRSTQVIQPNGQRLNEGPFRQVSRLGNPLVNEVVIPLGLKDAFNSLQPSGDAIAAPFVLDPELPKLIRTALAAFNNIQINIPPAPRNDLVQIFATGIPVNNITGPNYTTFLSDGTPHEFLRLNVAIPPSATPNRLGLLGGDVAGFPNGRRPLDDVTDIALRAVLGGTPFTPAFNVAPNNAVGDGVSMNEQPFLDRFPYLAPPNQGNQPRVVNFPSQLVEEGGIAPIVDENGSLLKDFGNSKK